MRAVWLLASLSLLSGDLSARADEPKKAQRTFQVPYRLTDTQHVLVRAKINGKGPFNFIIDTGAPLVFVATSVGKKLGLQADKGWATLERFEVEGGPARAGFKCRVETPFQLEGMNAMGLAGAELHGIIGYTFLAHYRLEFDFTRKKMGWTELAGFTPPPPAGIGGKGAAGGLDMIAGVMKFLGLLTGNKAAPPESPRGFLGLTLTDREDGVTVKGVLPEGPAARAGLRSGDQIQKVQGKGVQTAADVHRLTARVSPGQTVSLEVLRGGEKQEISVRAGEGL